MFVGCLRYTLAFKFPQRKKSAVVRSGDRGGHGISDCLPIQRLGKWESKHCRTIREKCAGAPSC